MATVVRALGITGAVVIPIGALLLERSEHRPIACRHFYPPSHAFRSPPNRLRREPGTGSPERRAVACKGRSSVRGQRRVARGFHVLQCFPVPSPGSDQRDEWWRGGGQ